MNRILGIVHLLLIVAGVLLVLFPQALLADEPWGGGPLPPRQPTNRVPLAPFPTWLERCARYDTIDGETSSESRSNRLTTLTICSEAVAESRSEAKIAELRDLFDRCEEKYAKEPGLHDIGLNDIYWRAKNMDDVSLSDSDILRCKANVAFRVATGRHTRPRLLPVSGVATQGVH